MLTLDAVLAMFALAVDRLRGLEPPVWISLGALAVSITSLCVSTLGFLRDRPKLKIKAQLYCSVQYGDGPPGYIEVKAINVGRRPMYLVMLRGADKQGDGSGSYLDYQGPGIKLGEHEFTVLQVTHLPRGKNQYNADAMNEDDWISFDRMWIEDSTGKQHKVPDMSRLLPLLRADYKEWCERTGYWKTPAPVQQAPDAVESHTPEARGNG